MQVYEPETLSRTEVDALTGAVVVDFGANWCGHCQGAQPLIADALAGHPGVRHLRVEDGPGRPLGRSFRVKLWPTLVFMRDGQEIDRLVRPEHVAQIEVALAKINTSVKPSGA